MTRLVLLNWLIALCGNGMQILWLTKVFLIVAMPCIIRDGLLENMKFLSTLVFAVQMKS